MNDEEFSQAMGYASGVKKQLAQEIRRITASLCKVDSSAIEPDEDTDRLANKMPDGWDETNFLLQLEHASNTPLDSSIHLPNFATERFFFFYKKLKPRNYGEWVKSVVELLAPFVASSYS